MIGYKYITEQEAINSLMKCNIYYCIPKSPEDITQNWVSYKKDKSGFWYIIYDESLLSILGQPIEFEITDNEATN